MAKGAGQAGGKASELSGQVKGQASELSGQLKGQATGLSGQLKGQATGLSGQLKGQADAIAGQLKGRVAQSPLDIRDVTQSVRDAALSVRGTRLSAREKLVSSISPSRTKRRAKLPRTDAMLKAQLVKTSRDLAHESSDLNAAVDSLNRVIKANQKAAAKGRTRLLAGVALGAALVYHLDAQQGRQRRAASARLITGVVRGQGGTPPGAV